MRNLKLAMLTALLSVSALTSQAAFAADKQWDKFLGEFRAALAKSDKAKIADMTKIPYYYDNGFLNREQYIKKIDVIFPKDVKAGLARNKPVRDKDGSYMIFNDDLIYVFNKVKGEYKFTDISVDD